MLAVMFKKINLLFTMNTINFDYGKLMIIILEFMLPSSIIFNVCCLFIELYPTFNVRLYICEENMYLYTWIINNTVIG